MTRPHTLGEVIAERRLLLAAAGRPARAVVVQLARPVAVVGESVGDDCCCAVQVTIDGDPGPVYAIGGVDAMQALQLAWAFADGQLSLLARDPGGTLLWPGGDHYDVNASVAGPPAASNSA